MNRFIKWRQISPCDRIIVGVGWSGLGWDGVGLLFWILLGASTKPPATAVLIINGYLPMKNYFYILGFIFPE